MNKHPIVTIQMAGRILAQGETVEPAEHGYIPSDMHGNVAIRDGDRVLVGKPIEKVRK